MDLMQVHADQADFLLRWADQDPDEKVSGLNRQSDHVPEHMPKRITGGAV